MSSLFSGRIRYLAWLGVAVMSLAGCSTPGLQVNSTEEQGLTAILARSALFGPRPELPTPADIHRLTPEQRRDFLAYMQAPENAAFKPNMRLYYYLERITRHYSYEGVTLPARETLATNSGNCMSLAILTTALAEMAGVEIGYQLMDDVPVYEFNDKAVIKGLHIRSILYDPALMDVDGALLFARPGINIDYFPTNRQRFVSNLDRNEYLAMYYENKAAEAFQAGDMKMAYWLARQALDLVPDYSPAINTLAVVHRHAGAMETAETIYQYGIAHAQDKLSLLKNYSILLENTGRMQEARAIQARLERMDDPSPFHWYELGQSSYDEGDYRTAIRYYNKALKIAPYLHEAYLGIALSSYALGEFRQTQHALVLATQESEKVSTRRLYEAKLAALSREWHE